MKKENEQTRNVSLNGPDMAGSEPEVKAVKSQVSLSEESTLSFWKENEIFEKSLDKNDPTKNPESKGEFVVYDGPPFATGVPHYGHILASVLKDIIPRYKTMRGYYVPRKWGWDCHGVPIENLIQKENNLATKQDIEKFGIKNFSQKAKESVFRYDEEWKKVIPRIGRWVDMENQYTTMDSGFMESVWWAFSELNKKGLVYEGFKTMQISPALETPLSNFEVNQGYKDITDISVYVKFVSEENPDTYFLAWTTTPWTLPGNVALAVGPEIDYVKVLIKEGDFKDNKIILAKPRIESVLSQHLKGAEYEVVEELKGSDLVGKKYLPLFDYYSKKTDLENRENGWKIYSADFVTTEDGTGIVHIAPAFGEDDLNLGKVNSLPFVQHVNIDGTIKSEATDFAGKQAKPKNDPTETDVLVIKWLAHHGNLFAKEKITHSYPHCYRTDVPLLNYAMSSWFVRVTDYREKMMAENEKVNWVPSAIGEKRFGNWLANIKDWGISRARYWGTPIPVWKSEDGEMDVIGSLRELKDRTKSSNKYFILRHGEANHNVEKILAADNSVESHLTDNGVSQIKKASEELFSKFNKKIDYIYCSPLNRAKETAKIISERFGFDENEIVIDSRLKEVGTGVLNGHSTSEYRGVFANTLEKFYKAPAGGETLVDIRNRVGDFIYEIDSKHEGKNVLIITHEYPIWMLTALLDGLDNKQASAIKIPNVDFVPPGTLIEYEFAKIPHDEYVLDLHRPYIDEISYIKDGKKFSRIKDVFDTWFDSGSMPFAVPHYPFEKSIDPIGGKKILGFSFGKTRGFPADFIAEGLDQTRGWFYTLLALNTMLFGKVPFKNVVVNGLILAEDGRKMSKSLKNYPDTNLVVDKYGADAIRYFLLSSPAVKADPVNFSEKGVDEVSKKVINRLLNVVSFYELYVDPSESKLISSEKIESENPLDVWIGVRLQETSKNMTESLDKYLIDSATRQIGEFVEDLSVWYLRRSRDRFKSDDQEEIKKAKSSLKYVLMNFSKLLAPFMPFLAENVYQRVSGFNFSDSNKSVHLDVWFDGGDYDDAVLRKMEKVRSIVTLGLEARDTLQIRVRQPLQTLKISEKTSDLGADFVSIVAEELNVKEVIYDSMLEKNTVTLDSDITEELFNEGVAREVVRFIQSQRKNANLSKDDEINISIDTDDRGKGIIEKHSDYIKKVTNALKIELEPSDNAEELKIDEIVFRIGLK